MTKKPYQAPVVKKVSLQVKTSVLALCRTSTDITSLGGINGCKPPLGACYS